MRVILLALMLAFAGVGFVALAAEPAAAEFPCDRQVIGGTQCCWYLDDDGFVRWRPC